MTGNANLPPTWKRFVDAVFTPVPPALGPSTLKKLVPSGEPTTACGRAKLPMNPAGAAGATAGSHVRKGSIAPARAAPKDAPHGAARQPTSTVSFTAPALL